MTSTPQDRTRNSKPSTAWIQDIPAKDRKNFEENLSYFLRTDSCKQLRKIITRRLQELETSTERNLSSYDSPGWNLRQAHLNGARHELLNILDLIGHN